jgi:hypothetical protein
MQNIESLQKFVMRERNTRKDLLTFEKELIILKTRKEKETYYLSSEGRVKEERAFNLCLAEAEERPERLEEAEAPLDEVRETDDDGGGSNSSVKKRLPVM